MISQCPHCQRALNFSGAQRQKIDEALGRLGPGGAIKIGCPYCGQPIQMKKDGGAGGEIIPPGENDGGWEGAEAGRTGMPEPPRPPDNKWLATGTFDEKEEVRDVPKALVLMPDAQPKTVVTGAFVELFYQVMQARNSLDAVEQMRYTDFSVVALHTGFEAGGLQNSAFHNHIRQLPMSKRRNIYYILMGSEFQTFYDLQALANSANLVVHDSDIRYMKTIFRKGLRDNQDLFEPYLQALKALGKK